MSDLFPITDVDKLNAVQREIEMRRRVYPRMIDSGKMTAGKAAREITLMEAIAADYQAKVAIVTVKVGDWPRP